MSRFRLARVARETKQVVSRIISQEIKDPRCGFVTVTEVKVAPDLKTARVGFSVFGTEKEKNLARRALQNARGFIQGRLSQETAFRFTPVITFVLDRSPERDIKLIREIDATVAQDERDKTARTIRARSAAGSIPDAIRDEINRLGSSPEFIEQIADLVSGLTKIDTTPRADLDRLAAAEDACFDVIDDALTADWGDEITIELHPILPEIAEHLAYTPPRYAAGDGQGPPPPDVVYADRGNLVALLPQAAQDEEAELDRPPAIALALNAHIDTAPPHIGPSREGEIVRGSGACAGKGQAAAIVAALRLLRRVRDTHNVRLCRDLCCQFVIDGEAGGNGTLSIAEDDAFPVGGFVVCRPTDLGACTAAPGEVWYRAELPVPPDRAAEAAADLIIALEEAGRAIREESRHPLFPDDRPVSTNHGVIGPFGSGPAQVNERIELEVRSDLDLTAIEQAARRAIDEYIAGCGEQPPEAETADPHRHLTVEPRSDECCRITLHGGPDEVGRPDRCGSAAVKAAYVILALADLRTPGKAVDIRLVGHSAPTLVVEGSQGFLPTHGVGDVCDRVRRAARSALPRVEVTFERLHNDAFDRPPDSALAVYAEQAGERAGVPAPPPPAGSSRSSDARIFAEFFPDRDVIVFGPGRPDLAHGPDEQIDLRRLAAGARALAFLVLEASGFVC